MEGKITSIALTAIYPPLFPEVKAIALPEKSDKAVLLVRVEQSDETPHTIDGHTGFYIRSNDISAPRNATMEEIEWLQNRRKNANDNRIRLLKRAVERSDYVFRSKAYDYSEIIHDAPKFYVFAIPRYPTEPLISMRDLFTVLEGTPFNTSSAKTCHESLITTFNAGPSCFGTVVNEVNIFGLIYHRSDHVYAPTGVEKFEKVLRSNILLRNVHQVLSFARGLYIKLQYGGLIHVAVCMKNIWGRKLINDSFGKGNFNVLGETTDHEIDILRRRTLASNFIENFDEFMIDLSSELLLSTGMGTTALDRTFAARLLQAACASTK